MAKTPGWGQVRLLRTAVRSGVWPWRDEQWRSARIGPLLSMTSLDWSKPAQPEPIGAVTRGRVGSPGREEGMSSCR